MAVSADRRGIRVPVLIPPRVYARLEARAAACGLTVSAWIAEYVEVSLLPERCAHVERPAAETEDAGTRGPGQERSDPWPST